MAASARDRPSADELRAGCFVVVPAHDEEACIAGVLRELSAGWPQVVVVDDGSSDATAERARPHARWLLRHAVNRGQGAALQTGFTFALRRGARWLVSFDADGQHRVEDISVLLEPILDGECQVTLGSRFLGREPLGMPWSRRLVLRLGVLFTRLTSGVRLSDAHNGLRAFTREAAERIEIVSDRMEHASEIVDQLLTARLAWREVPVEVRYTEYSLAKGQSLGSALKIAFHTLTRKVMR